MSPTPMLAGTATLLAALATALVLMTSESLAAEDAAALAAIDLVVVSAVAAVGLGVAHSRWARRLIVGLCLVEIAIGFLAGLGWLPILGVVLALIALAVVGGPWTRAWVASPPPVDAPPAQAVLLTLALLITPGWIALWSRTGLTMGRLVLALGCFFLAWAYARAQRWALLFVRVAFLGITIVLMIGSTATGAVAIAVYVVAIVVLGWTPEAARAIEPGPARSSTPVALPKELIPRDILATWGHRDRSSPRKKS